MKIKKEKCIAGCKECHAYCTVGAIIPAEWEGKALSAINQEECVECGICLRSQVCPADAIYLPELPWPRSVREPFSNAVVYHPTTQIAGRGTEEMKSNDVTGRFRRGYAGVVIEMGRPSVGTTFRDLEIVAMALANLGIEFEVANPVANLMSDRKRGKIKEEVLAEKVLSAIIEFTVENNRLKAVLEKIKDVSSQIDTVFSLGLISRVNEDGRIPTLDIAREAGFSPRPNTKTNVGLGRPLKGD